MTSENLQNIQNMFNCVCLNCLWKHIEKSVVDDWFVLYQNQSNQHHYKCNEWHLFPSDTLSLYIYICNYYQRKFSGRNFRVTDF